MLDTQTRVQIGAAFCCVAATLLAATLFVAEIADGGRSPIAAGCLLAAIAGAAESYFAIRGIFDDSAERVLWLHIVSRVAAGGALLAFAMALTRFG